jgi:hypothetical protein
MKSLWKDESADSMIIFVIASGILVFGLAYIVLNYSINLPIGSMNTLIDQGKISLDTVTHFATMVQMWQAAPFFFVIGLILWCFERSKGESVTSDTYFGYLILMIITIQISAYFVWVFGMSLDSFTSFFENCADFMNISSIWDVSDVRNICINGMYYSAMLPGFIGSVLYMLHPIMKQRENAIYDFWGSDQGQNVDGNGEYITNYSLEQM